MPVGAAVAIGTSVVGGLAQNAAAKKNARAAQNIANQNQQAISGTQAANTALFAPAIERGNAAGDALNAFLGLPVAGSSPQAQSQAQWDQYLQQNPDVNVAMQREISNPKSQLYGMSLEDAAQWHYQNHGQGEGRALPATQVAAPGGADPAQTSKQAFDNYLNSTGYQFTANAGRDAINSSKASRGLLKSGSALKALEKFSAGNANQFTQGYISNLYNQQQSGLSAAGNNASSNASVLGATTANNASVLPAQVAANTTTANVLTNIANQAASAYGGVKGASSYGSPGGNPTMDWEKMSLQGGWS